MKFAESNEIGNLGIAKVTEWLNRDKRTLDLVSVEGDKEYQLQGIDLIWITTQGRFTIEVKTDTQYRTNNYFFETVSNKTKGTEGCFISSKADIMAYYFLDKEIHFFNLPEAQDWFRVHGHKYPLKTSNSELYESEGRAVLRKDLSAALQVKVIKVL